MDGLGDVPPDELAELLDMLIWNGAGAGREQVAVWHAELLARPDRDAQAVRLAADVCLEYLAEAGSPFERRIEERVRRGFGLHLPYIRQDN